MKARINDHDRARIRDCHPGVQCAVPEPLRESSRWVDRVGGARARMVGRAAFWILGTVAVLLVWPPATAAPRASSQFTWDLEISADGDQPVTALVYGEGSGVHLITIPGAAADPADRGDLPIRPGIGDVHIFSLGWSGLSIRTTPPVGGPLLSATARARSATLFSNPKGSGVRTGW